METLDDLWEYCTANNRVVPNPQEWTVIFDLLKNKKQNQAGAWKPSVPLILGAWHYTSPLEKQMRFKEHIQWANENGQLDEIGSYIRSLSEDKWYHFGEL